MHASQQVLVQLHLDPTVPEEVLKEVRNCIRRGNAHKSTASFEARLDEVFTQITNLNLRQIHIDHDQPVGDDINVRAELLLEASQQVENALGNMGGPQAIRSPIEGISVRGEFAVQTAYMILHCVSNQMGSEGRAMDDDQIWWSS